jgi:hypothetical protein
MKAHSELIRCCCSIDLNSGQGSLTFPASSVGVENLKKYKFFEEEDRLQVSIDLYM